MINNIQAIFRIIKQLLYVLTPKQKKQSLIVFFTMLLSSCLELLGVSSIFPLLQLMMVPEEASTKWYTKWVYDVFPQISYKEMLVLFCILIILVFLAKNALSLLIVYIQNRFAVDFQCEMSVSMLDRFLNYPYEYFVNTNSTVIQRAINGDVGSVHAILLALFQMAGEMITIGMIGVYLFALDFFVAICALTLAAVSFVLMVGVFKGKMKILGKNVREASMLQNKCSYQAILGIKEVTILERKKIFIDEYRKHTKETARCQLISSVINSCPDRILEGVCLSGFIGVVAVRIMISDSSMAFVPVLGSFAMGAFKILPSISKVSGRINQIVFSQFGLKSVYDNIKEYERIQDENARLGVEADNDYNYNMNTTEHDHIVFQDKLVFDNISWHYRNSTENVLNNLSMEIRKGESVALIGSSGAGKTTLADIIMSLLKPQSGTIYMDGHDIFLIPHSWHRQIGYVPQAVYLIDDTIRANVAFGLPREQVSDEKAWAALEQAQLKSFVEGLPDGLDTIVGERGVKFSGGQRQRIAVARALYENPSVLVLDEATSALDNETEAALMESIETLQGHKTLIIIAHRLTTIRNCDRIYEIVDGVAIERRHEEIFS